MAADQTTKPDEPGAEEDRGYEVPNRPWLVHGAIIVAFAVFVSMVALLYTRWANTSAPNSTMIFAGDERMNGVQVRVDGPALDKSIARQLAKENGYMAKFAVPAGTYLVRLTRDGVPLGRETAISAQDGMGVQYDLTKMLRLDEPGEGGGATTRPQ